MKISNYFHKLNILFIDIIRKRLTFIITFKLKNYKLQMKYSSI